MNFMRRHKKAVSPVIAVVLLIALTAAAVGVVWVLFQNLSGSGAVVTVTSTTHTYAENATHTVYTWTGTIKSTSDATITSASWGSSLTNSSLSISLTGGSEKVVTITFTSLGTHKSGSDILSLTVNVGGNDQIVKTESFQWNL